MLKEGTLVGEERNNIRNKLHLIHELAKMGPDEHGNVHNLGH